MLRRLLRSVLLILAIATTGVAPSPALAQDKPNIVLVFMDNFGWGEPGFNGGGIIRGAPTPRLDKLASQGLRLTNFNVEAQCTPSRSAIMTGRYAIRSGNGVAPLGGDVYGLVQWEVTMAEMLADVGYATGMFGKWHLGRTTGRFPTDQGFDEWYGIPNSTDESAYAELEGFAESGVEETYVMEGRRGEAPTKVRPYRLDYRPLIDGDLTEKAIDFMKRQAGSGKPFFVFLPYTATHYPTRPHPDFVGKTGNGVWADLLLQIDTYNGRLLDTIDELGIADNTIFIFTADNGPEAVPHGNVGLAVATSTGGTAGPWRGTLFTGLEGSLRVPFAIRWPNEIPAGSESNEIVHEMDLFPTLAKFAGGQVPDDRVIDGIDMSDFFLGKSKESGRDGVIVYMGNDIYGVKWRNWKVNFKELVSVLGETIDYGMPRVYNLLRDPQERENVLFPNTWVPKAALAQLGEHAVSLKAHPPIKPGTLDPTSHRSDWLCARFPRETGTVSSSAPQLHSTGNELTASRGPSRSIPAAGAYPALRLGDSTSREVESQPSRRVGAGSVSPASRGRSEDRSPSRPRASESESMDGRAERPAQPIVRRCARKRATRRCMCGG